MRIRLPLGSRRLLLVDLAFGQPAPRRKTDIWRNPKIRQEVSPFERDYWQPFVEGLAVGWMLFYIVHHVGLSCLLLGLE